MDKDAMRLHQGHPAKLATDWLSGLAALALLWQGRAFAGVMVLLVPPLVGTLLVLRFVDLAPLKATRWGRALVRRMVPALQGLRLAGFLVAAVGAWLHAPAEIAVGLALVLAAWGPVVADALRASPA